MPEAVHPLADHLGDGIQIAKANDAPVIAPFELVDLERKYPFDLEVDLNHEGEYLTLPVLVVHIDPRTLEQKLIIT